MKPAFRAGGILKRRIVRLYRRIDDNYMICAVGYPAAHETAKIGWWLERVVEGLRFSGAVRMTGRETMTVDALSTRGFVLAVLIQRRRDSRAVQRLMKKLLKSAGTPPRVMITDSSLHIALDVRGS